MLTMAAANELVDRNSNATPKAQETASSNASAASQQAALSPARTAAELSGRQYPVIDRSLA